MNYGSCRSPNPTITGKKTKTKPTAAAAASTGEGSNGRTARPSVPHKLLEQTYRLSLKTVHPFLAPGVSYYYYDYYNIK